MIAYTDSKGKKKIITVSAEKSIEEQVFAKRYFANKGNGKWELGQIAEDYFIRLKQSKDKREVSLYFYDEELTDTKQVLLIGVIDAKPRAAKLYSELTYEQYDSELLEDILKAFKVGAKNANYIAKGTAYINSIERVDYYA